jgi:hypothetical protein
VFGRHGYSSGSETPEDPSIFDCERIVSFRSLAKHYNHLNVPKWRADSMTQLISTHAVENIESSQSIRRRSSSFETMTTRLRHCQGHWSWKFGPAWNTA